jgi:hypothetical protein
LDIIDDFARVVPAVVPFAGAIATATSEIVTVARESVPWRLG